MEDLLRFGPLVFLAATCLWLMVATRRTSSEIGRKAYGFGGSTRQQVAQGLFRVSVVAALLSTAGHAAGLDWAVLVPLFADPAWMRYAGLALALGGSLLTMFAQSNMGRRWRVGVPDAAPDALVTAGLFGFSRNPVFLAMLTLAVGLAAALSSPVMIACAAVFWLACQIQVRDEERYLGDAFGAQYAAYRTQVRRWV
ncbi:Phospholipid methyltransferase [Fulvimarina manganoxydans]|uniref:Phospholipid methyltransferase n=1 Tax=Fulvimarina manganoxydans TaxID=937218 RepID=A0A1W2BZ12_9HYPH|nr:isoprenylcysteine carboxylmethyltransferase family protein [Fulvimarina manganoxydans]MCK5931696.1 isoprenylcysteine carboxylmethyltransferase family protein [Fulvimarina manganoxydans]SMC77728.1 Phospholipid methyltransferase [Fulvimarina manganoxydans]